MHFIQSITKCLYFSTKTRTRTQRMEKICFGDFGKKISKAKPYLLTVGLQFGFAGALIISMATFNHGMNRFVFIVYRNVIAAIALAPFALIFERFLLYYHPVCYLYNIASTTMILLGIHCIKKILHILIIF